jgi:hypothetical protein
MFNRSRSTSFLLFCCAFFLALGCASTQPTQPTGQTRFDSPQAAADSLVTALRAHNTEQLNKIFGPDGGEILSSGDPVADQAGVERFLAAYDAKHRLDTDSNGQNTLIVGPQDWPFPVPIVKTDGKFTFDTEAGKDEILNRRIGRNELATEMVCLAIVDAQRDYVALRPMGGDLPVYARRLMSTPGTKDGLYWPTQEGEPPSPMGPLVALASAEGYRATTRVAGQPPPPYHGYRYKLLTAQGPSAEGGSIDYVVDGKLIGGFAVVAWPAQYGNSGIMSFITNHNGVVYQKDLGEDTEKIAQAMTEFDPGPGWTKTADATMTKDPADPPESPFPPPASPPAQPAGN